VPIVAPTGALVYVEAGASLALLLIIVWFCWLVSVFVGWLRHGWRKRHLRGWEWLHVYLSAGWIVLGFVICRPAEWWEHQSFCCERSGRHHWSFAGSYAFGERVS
jgi:hypothetical protein